MSRFWVSQSSSLHQLSGFHQGSSRASKKKKKKQVWRNQGEVPMEWEKCRRCLVCSQTRAVIWDMRGMCYCVNSGIETQRRIFSCPPTHSPGDLDKWHNLRGPVLTSLNTRTISPSTFRGCQGDLRETRQRCFKTVFPPSEVFLKLFIYMTPDWNRKCKP